MNREILFRGKDVGGPWRYGGIVHQTDFYGSENDDYRIIDGTTSDDNNLGYSFSVIPETVGQYTGLTDKNGKKIFEGDILQYPAFELGEEKFPEHYEKVRWGDGGWESMGESYIEILVQETASEVVVAGNIWDNPELLEEKP